MEFLIDGHQSNFVAIWTSGKFDKMLTQSVI